MKLSNSSFVLLKRFSGQAKALNDQKERLDFLKSINGLIFILGFGLYYGGGGRGLWFDSSKYEWSDTINYQNLQGAMMAVIDDKTKELKTTKEEVLEAKIDNQNILVRKKGSKK